MLPLRLPPAPPSHAISFQLAFGGFQLLARLSSAGCKPFRLATLCVMPPSGLQRFALPARSVSCPTLRCPHATAASIHHTSKSSSAALHGQLRMLRATFGVAAQVGQPFGLPSARQAASRLAGGRRALRSRRPVTSPHQPFNRS